MNKPPPDGWEKQVQEAAQAFSYPPTPDIVHGIRERQQRKASMFPRRLAYAALLLLLLVIGLMSVPTVRANILDFLQFGAIRIWLVEPTPTTTTDYRLTPTPELSPTAQPFVIDDLIGESTFAEAQAKTSFALRLPSYPEELGEPDRVFLHDEFEQAVLLVWLVPGSQNEVNLSLHQLKGTFWGKKLMPQGMEQTTVNGEPAAWLAEPHEVHLFLPGYEGRLVEGNVLIWSEDEITYRLETQLPRKEAVHLAESLR